MSASAGSTSRAHGLILLPISYALVGYPEISGKDYGGRTLEALGYTWVEDLEAGYEGRRKAGYELVGEEA